MASSLGSGFREVWEQSLRVVTLSQGFSAGGNFVLPRGYLAVPGDIFDGHNCEVGCCEHVMCRGQDAVEHPTMHRTPPNPGHV